MIIFLTSSPTGPLDGSRPVDGLDKMNNFVVNLRKYWKPDSRCLMIAAAPDEPARNDEMCEFFAGVLRKENLSFSTFDLWDRRTTDFSEETLKSYDVIWLGGGHVPTQNRFFHEIQLREKIADFQGIVIGISAGTMNSADEVYAQPELPGEAGDPDFVRYIRGLGLTKTKTIPHYQMVKDWYLDGMRLYEDFTYGDSWGKTFLVLTDGSYLFIENGEETGYGETYVINDGKILLICSEDKTCRWK